MVISLSLHFIAVNKPSRSDDSSSTSTISTTAMEQIVERLKGSKHRGTTRKNYLSVWRSFNQFFIKLDRKPKTWEDRIILFVGFLIESNKKSQTVRSYVSAIKSVLGDDGIQINEDRCLINALTKACKLTNDKVRTRLPIQKGLLQIIFKYVRLKFQTQPYLEKMYLALFAATYYGLFRVGEVTESEHVVKAMDVHIAHNKNKMMFVLRSSKTHCKGDKPQVVKISGEKLDDYKKNLACDCPFELLKRYVAVRRSCRNIEEQFFIFRDRSPVTAQNMRSTLKDVLKAANFNISCYDTHSMRAGRAVDLLSMKVDVSTIAKLGRWSSNAVFTYLSIY